jgi:tRNA threonylcarbamoyladenosine biosynthesis protein TsaE
VILLVGGLGAGKTTFAQGFAAGLGIEGPVTSPTFTLVRQYRCPPGNPAGIAQLLHADVYRLETLTEVAELALAELVEEAAVALVEWGDLAAPVLPADTLRSELGIDAAGGDEEPARRITLSTTGDAWSGRRQALAEAVTPFHPVPHR